MLHEGQYVQVGTHKGKIVKVNQDTQIGLQYEGKRKHTYDVLIEGIEIRETENGTDK